MLSTKILNTNKILSTTSEYHRFGLASFDKELRLEAPVGSDSSVINNAAKNAAKNAGIIITSIGCPGSVPQSVSLQTLRRLSEETGGIYIEADNQLNIPTDFFEPAI